MVPRVAFRHHDRMTNDEIVRAAIGVGAGRSAPTASTRSLPIAVTEVLAGYVRDELAARASGTWL